jgi:hypothetical protein
VLTALINEKGLFLQVILCNCEFVSGLNTYSLLWHDWMKFLLEFTPFVLFNILLYNFNQFISHMSQGPLTKRNLVSVTGHLAAWWKGRLSHIPKYGNFGYYWVLSDEISPLSQPASQVDEMKISSGVSQSHMGDKLIEIVQYCHCDKIYVNMGFEQQGIVDGGKNYNLYLQYINYMIYLISACSIPSKVLVDACDDPW